jgi:hypothetical protein
MPDFRSEERAEKDNKEFRHASSESCVDCLVRDATIVFEAVRIIIIAQFS